jgi:hypothetical protein
MSGSAGVVTIYSDVNRALSKILLSHLTRKAAFEPQNGRLLRLQSYPLGRAGGINPVIKLLCVTLLLWCLQNVSMQTFDSNLYGTIKSD